MAYGQLDLDWEVSVDRDPAKLPFQYRQFVYKQTYVSESSFSGSLIIRVLYENPANDDSQGCDLYYHINKSGNLVGQFVEFFDWTEQPPTHKRPVFVGEDWMIVTGLTPDLGFEDWKNEYRLATGQGNYVTAAMPHDFSISGPDGWVNFFSGHRDLRTFYPGYDQNWQQPNGFYRIKETSERVYVQKFSPRLRVTDLQPNSAPQSSISRTDSGITLSTDTQVGQSYRVQSSQDLKQWSDEEIIQGDGGTKSVQRAADKPKEFLRVVEE